MAVARVEEARARAGIAKSFLYPQVDGVANYGVRQASNAPRTDDRRRHDASERHLRLPAVLGARSVRPASGASRKRRSRWCWRASRAAAACSSRWSATSRRTTSCCASSTCSSRSRGRRCDLNDETVDVLPEPARRRRVEPARARSHPGATGRRPPRRSRTSSGRSPIVENALSLLLGRPPGADPARRRSTPDEPLPPPIPPGLPASLLERRPDVVAGRAAAGRRQRRHRRRQGAVLSDDQPDRLSRRRQRRSHDVPRRRRRRVVARRRAAAAGLPGRTPPPEPRGDAGALRRGARRSTRRRRSTATARWPTRWSRFRSWRKCAAQRQIGVDRAAGRLRPVARALRFGPGQLHRDPDRRPGPVRSSSCCWRRRAAPSCGRARSCTARSAAAGSRRRADDETMASDKIEETEATRSIEKELLRLQGKLCVLQEWVKAKGLRVIVVFEGRDAAGKGGTIKAITERVSPRVFRVVALPAPSDREKSQMYLQRYMQHFPGGGRDRHLRPQLVQPRRRRARDGLLHRRAVRAVPRSCARCSSSTSSTAASSLIKFWLEVGNKEQERRFEARIDDPLRQWKLSPMDLPSRAKWYEYSRARDAMLKATDTRIAPVAHRPLRRQEARPAQLHRAPAEADSAQEDQAAEGEAAGPVEEARLRRRGSRWPGAGSCRRSIEATSTARRRWRIVAPCCRRRARRCARSALSAARQLRSRGARSLRRRSPGGAVGRDGHARRSSTGRSSCCGRGCWDGVPPSARPAPSAHLDDLVDRRSTRTRRVASRSRAASLITVASRGVLALTPPDVDELSGETLERAAGAGASRACSRRSTKPCEARGAGRAAARGRAGGRRRSLSAPAGAVGHRPRASGGRRAGSSRSPSKRSREPGSPTSTRCAPRACSSVERRLVTAVAVVLDLVVIYATVGVRPPALPVHAAVGRVDARVSADDRCESRPRRRAAPFPGCSRSPDHLLHRAVLHPADRALVQRGRARAARRRAGSIPRPRSRRAGC